MSPLAMIFARTFLIGVAIAAPVGAMGMLCIQRTLSRGWRAGIATGLGIATADGVYAGLAAFGVAAVSAVLVAWQMPLRLVGGAVLVVLGVRSLVRGSAHGEDVSQSPTPDAVRPRHATDYASAVALTLANPTTIMAFGAVFASAGLVAQPGVASVAVATVGIATGSLAWWAILTAGVSLVRQSSELRFVAIASMASGFVIAVFGVLALASAVWPIH